MNCPIHAPDEVKGERLRKYLDTRFDVTQHSSGTAGRNISDEMFQLAVEFLQKDAPGTDWTDSYEALRMGAFAAEQVSAAVDKFIEEVEKLAATKTCGAYPWDEDYAISWAFKQMRSVAERRKGE